MMQAAISVLPEHYRAKEHAFFFLLMQTGLTGVFAARDLLLFYLFFEVALVPMYFIIGLWGHERRRYAAIKFFLYTRAGSLAMLLSFLALYLAAEPRTFSLEALAAIQPFAGSPAGSWVLLGLLIGFGVKLPVFPLHNWLPDAHVEAPTEGSVILAGIQLKMGAYGLIAIVPLLLPQAAHEQGWWLLALGVFSLIYGALAALAQDDFKRLIAYTSISHMGFVLIGTAVWALAGDPGVRRLALDGAALQAVSHGLLTGGMFFLVGFLQQASGTRDLGRFGGLLKPMPRYCALLGLLAFGSLGLPGFSGFIAEFQVIGAALPISLWGAGFVVLGIVITTAVYLKVLYQIVFGETADGLAALADLDVRQLASVIPLVLASLAIGLLPFWILRVIEGGTRLLTGG